MPCRRIRSLVGERFSRLTVLSQYVKNYESTCWCVCDCGSEKEIPATHLLTGNTRSCGCLNREIVSEIGKKTGPENLHLAVAASVKHGMCGTPEYNAWLAMNDRCTDSNNRWYGRKGIKVCPEWQGPGGFERWYAHIGPKPEPKYLYSQDRYPNPAGNYEPGNVRWATKAEQRNNQSKTL
jgi:hypothetical protein